MILTQFHYSLSSLGMQSHCTVVSPSMFISFGSVSVLLVLRIHLKDSLIPHLLIFVLLSCIDFLQNLLVSLPIVPIILLGYSLLF